MHVNICVQHFRIIWIKTNARTPTVAFNPLFSAWNPISNQIVKTTTKLYFCINIQYEIKNRLFISRSSVSLALQEDSLREKSDHWLVAKTLSDYWSACKHIQLFPDQIIFYLYLLRVVSIQHPKGSVVLLVKGSVLKRSFNQTHWKV